MNIEIGTDYKVIKEIEFAGKDLNPGEIWKFCGWDYTGTYAFADFTNIHTGDDCLIEKNQLVCIIESGCFQLVEE